MAKKSDQYTEKLKLMEDSVAQKLIKLREKRGEYFEISDHVLAINSVIGCRINSGLKIKEKSYATVDEMLDAYCYSLDENDIMCEFLKDEECSLYFKTFMERYFERNKETIQKEKPKEELYEVWFGDNNNCFCLMITPVFRAEDDKTPPKWENDKSEIRKVGFRYWSVNHVLKTGVINMINSSKVSFDDINSLINFYKINFYDKSKSIYEREIMNRYFELLRNTDDYDNIAFLIPEFRLLKGAERHKSRLDFTILAVEDDSKSIGFEISPDSTHAMILNIKDKSEDAIIKELSNKFHKEMSKSNDFYSAYDIHIETFTQIELRNIRDCFEEIKKYLIYENRKKIQRGAYKRLVQG